MTEHANLKLHAALMGVGEARHAVRLARSQDGRDALVRQLAEIETVLAGAVADLSSDLPYDDQDGGRAMERRALLKLTGAIAATAFTPLDAVERIAGALENPGRVDDRLLDAYEEVTTSYAEAFYTVAPAQLAGPVAGQLDRLVGLTRQASTPVTRTRLEAMIGDAAAFAGTLAYDLDQPGTARAHLALAADAATQAGDATLRAVSTATLALLHKQVVPGDRRTGALLDEAYKVLPDDGLAAARAWVAIQHASDCAAAGDRLGYEAGLEVAHAAVADEPDGQRGGFLSHRGVYRSLVEPQWFDHNRARGLAALQDRRAEPLLLGLVDEVVEPRMRANALNNLAALYATRNEVDEACSTARRALDLAAEQQLPSVVRKVRTTRTGLQAHHRARSVRELDAALAAA